MGPRLRDAAAPPLHLPSFHRLKIQDLKKSGAKRTLKLPPAVIARLWNDFRAFHQQPEVNESLSATGC